MELTYNNSTNLNLNVSCYPFGPILVGTQIRYLYGAAGIVTGILSLIVVFLNATVFVALIALKRYRTVSSILLVLLCVVDFLNGLLVLPTYTVYMRQLMDSKLDCVLAKCLILIGYSLNSMSMITILFNTIEIYLGIVKPFLHYRTIALQQYKYVKALLMCWAVIIGMVALFTFSFPSKWRWFKTIIGGLFLLAYVLLCTAHFRIVFAFREMTIRVRSLPQALQQTLHAERRTTQTLVGMLIAFGISFLPYIIYAAYIAVLGQTPVTRSYIGPWIEIFGMTNSLLDPIIYCVRMESVRKQIVKMFCIKVNGKKEIISNKTLD